MSHKKKEQKKQWQDGKEQLKADLANRKKIIKKREVKLSFGGKKKGSVKMPNSTHSNPSTSSNSLSEHIMRQNLGLY